MREAMSVVVIWLGVGLAAVPAGAAELARSDGFAPAFDPIGFADVDLLAVRGDDVLAFGPAGRRVLLTEPELQSAVTADGTLALIRGDRGQQELLAGPVDGARRSVLRCSLAPGRAGRPRPAVSDARVVWATCDRRGLVVAAAGGDRTLDAGGIVRAIAIDGDRAAWVAADGARPARLTVRTVDLRSGEITVAGMLGQDTDDVINVGIAVARDGRLQATLERLPGDRATCAKLVAGQAGPPSMRPGRCPRVVFTPEGSIVSRPASLPASNGRVTRVDRIGMVRSTISIYSARRLAPPLVTDGRRIALRLLTCRGSRLVVDEIAKASFPELACPVRPRRREVSVSRAGIVRIGVRCPSGCLAGPLGVDLRLGSLGLVPNAESFLDLRPHATGTVKFRLSQRQRHGIRRRGSVTARVRFVANFPRGFTVRLRAAK